MRSKLLKKFLLTTMIFLAFGEGALSQSRSIARTWNEVLLRSIRNDLARPTVHARNLFHLSALMYDTWTVFDQNAEPFLLGNTVADYDCPFDGFVGDGVLEERRRQAISYAAYRLLKHRFQLSPNASEIIPYIDSVMDSLGYDRNYIARAYESGNPADLGNYIAFHYIEFGKQDGANESSNYQNQFYEPVNVGLNPDKPGNPGLTDPNRWQPLILDQFIDQSGNPIDGDQPFLGAEWGSVVPFALSDEDKKIATRDGVEYTLYHDPGQPSLLGPQSNSQEDYIWGFALVAAWSGHLDPDDEVLWDVSPGSIGNVSDLPADPGTYRDFYDLVEGGDPGQGWNQNPFTGEPYDPQIVPRGDYTRVLAEFWADGPDSETPPGHWFTVLNYVSDHSALEKRFKGAGTILDDLEWDIKSYFALGGAVHDAAITAWGIKGYYDYTRPISAIRYMADQGQSSDSDLPNYNPAGIMLVPGLIELVSENDPLAGASAENIGKIKIYGWRGPDYIENPETTKAGVGWILAENWWPYQRPTFVTPPFAGYVSGHSTFSRAAAEVLTMLTGDPFFPGGMGEFIAKKNEFLIFEEGPSVDVKLQWATYRDASDQTSLSRIWGGIHPPVDDIPGRLLGIKVGVSAFSKAEQYFNGIENILYTSNQHSRLLLYPNPVVAQSEIIIKHDFAQESKIAVSLFDQGGSQLNHQLFDVDGSSIRYDISNLSNGTYIVKVQAGSFFESKKLVIAR